MTDTSRASSRVGKRLGAGPRMTAPVAFLFLGETLLIPHLWPIAEALAEAAPELDIDLWVATDVHERLLSRWIASPNLRLRRGPGFRAVGDGGDGRNPPLPPKLPTLARLAPALARASVVVSAEQTSLWLPALLPMRTRFVNALHGAGSMMNRHDRRRRAAWRTLVAAERERDALARAGVDPATVVPVGYLKSGFRHATGTRVRFDEPRPTLIYAPHWQRARSSWWRWGPDAVRRVLDMNRFNLLFAPHQRLAETAPDVRGFAAAIAGRGDVHCDLDGFAGVDGSYTGAADLYLGDTSSQVVEFLMTPRPCVFLDAQGADWRGDPSYDMWECGEVVTGIDALVPALERAGDRHARFVDRQRGYAAESLGDTSGAAPRRAAAVVMEALDRPR